MVEEIVEIELNEKGENRSKSADAVRQMNDALNQF
jgi:hypothetical protein